MKRIPFLRATHFLGTLTGLFACNACGGVTRDVATHGGAGGADGGIEATGGSVGAGGPGGSSGAGGQSTGGSAMGGAGGATNCNVEGDLCRTISDCCEPLICDLSVCDSTGCNYGVCQRGACAAVQNWCANDGDCCRAAPPTESVCYQSRCTTSPVSVDGSYCLPFGFPCSGDGDCCSGTCTAPQGLLTRQAYCDLPGCRKAGETCGPVDGACCQFDAASYCFLGVGSSNPSFCGQKPIGP